MLNDARAALKEKPGHIIAIIDGSALSKTGRIRRHHRLRRGRDAGGRCRRHGVAPQALLTPRDSRESPRVPRRRSCRRGTRISAGWMLPNKAAGCHRLPLDSCAAYSSPQTVQTRRCIVAVSKLDEVVSLAKRRGFVFPAGEIYGGTRSAWDYGPLGVALKDNIKRALVALHGPSPAATWWAWTHPSSCRAAVWVASGHVSVPSTIR